MKRLITFFTLTLLIFSIKLSALESIHWRNDIEKSQSTAKTENKPIILFFTGSDWCPACMSFEKNILSQETFIKSVQDKFVFVLLDFPRYQQVPPAISAHNSALLQKYAVRGFPTIVIVDSEMNEIAKTGYLQIPPEDYANHLFEVAGIE